MIEGEEIFESAEETGYRLCTSEQDIDTSIFSASWDKNDYRRMFICSQKGQLRVINTEHVEVSKYEIIFKRNTTYENSANEPEKIIHDHWDRMVTIPDRPNEIIFLLGISKKLYYTALPGSDSVSIATNVSYPKDTSVVITAATRPNFPGYIYGTPVMEISGHTGRVVSLAVSPAGHVLASGDELGNVRLLLLQLLDELSIIRKKEQRKRRHVVERQFNTFLPSYNITQKVHNHSVYSLEWLPLIQTRNDVRYYGLVTGSEDSSVRIWTVACCTKTGLSMIPCQSLNTMNTGVLCLNSYLLVDRQMEIQIARQLEGAKIQNMDDRHRDPFLPTKRHSSAREDYELNNAKSVYLAAGTDKGTVYVWKLHFHSIQKQLLVAAGVVVKDMPPVSVYAAESEDEEYEQTIQDPFSDAVVIRIAKTPPTTPKFTTFAIDDGTALHSLMQTSENPIIHVSITSNGNQSTTNLEQLVSNRTVDTSRLSNSDHILLAASDTAGMARLHTVDLTATNEARSENEFSLQLSRNEQAVQDSAENAIRRIKSSLHSGASYQLDQQVDSLGGMHSGGRNNIGLVNNNKPLVPAANPMHFRSMVVACAFQSLSAVRDESRSANNSGTNTPTSSMSPSHIRFNATSNQSSPAGSVSSGRDGGGGGRGGGVGLNFSILSLTPRTPSLAIVCSDGTIKLFASENMQTQVRGTLGTHDAPLFTAASSTTASSPASSESSVPVPIIKLNSRHSRPNSTGSVGNASNTSPNSRGSRSNVLFTSPSAVSGVHTDRLFEADSEIEARKSPIPRIQQTTGGGSQMVFRPVHGVSSTINSSNDSNNNKSVPVSRASPVKRPPPSIVIAPSGVVTSTAPEVPKVLNVGGGVIFKTNVTHNTAVFSQSATQSAQLEASNVMKSNINTSKQSARAKEDDSLSYPHKTSSTSAKRGTQNNTTTTATTSATRDTVLFNMKTSAALRVSEDDSSVEPRQPLTAANRLHSQQTQNRPPQTITRASTAPVTTTAPSLTQQPPQSTPVAATTSGGGTDSWTYERMSTQYKNDLAMASFHTVQIQKAQLNRLQDDEITVSTLQTTASDHKAAARAVVRNQPLNDNRYSFLTSATGPATEASKNKNASKMPKQTDPAYLARKQYCGPSEEDLKVLRSTDPLVSRDLFFTPSTPQSSGMRRPAAVSSSSSGKSRNVWDSVDTGVGTATTAAATNAAQNSRFRYNSEFGLYCDMDKSTLQPRFRTEVNADEVLGRVDVLGSLHLGRAAVLKMREGHMFSLISTAIV